MSQKRGSGVESVYEDYKALVLDLSNSPSGLAALNRSFHKHLLLAAASSLEDATKELVREIFDRHGTSLLAAFVDRRVMARSYHTLFDWNTGSAKAFFGSFGEACGLSFKGELRENPLFKKQHDAFMTLGLIRNQLVHNDYASAPVQLTPVEIIEMYRGALGFVDDIERVIFDL